MKTPPKPIDGTSATSPEVPADTVSVEQALLVAREPVSRIESEPGGVGLGVDAREVHAEGHARVTLKLKKRGEPLRVLNKVTA